MTGSAFSPAGSPLILTVTGALNDPLRMIFPLSSTVAPGLISSPVAASSSEAGGTTLSVTAGRSRTRSAPPSFRFGLKHQCRRSQGRSHRRSHRDFALAGFLAMLALGTARPAGSGSAVIARAASAPLVRTTFTGTVALYP